MGKGRTLTQVISLVLMLSVCMVGTADAAGPWKGQIVDVETGQPLEGVVVLAVWLSYEGTLGGWAGAAYFDAEEVVTGADGRFVIPARRTFSFWFRAVKGPELTIFKPGYGQWRFRGHENWPSDLIEREARVETAWKQFTRGGVVIELPRFQTREERLKFYGTLGWAPVIPSDRTKHLREAERLERAYLGFNSR